MGRKFPEDVRRGCTLRVTPGGENQQRSPHGQLCNDSAHNSEIRHFCSLLATADRLVKLRVELNRFLFTTDRTDRRLVEDAMRPGSLSLLLFASFPGACGNCASLEECHEPKQHLPCTHRIICQEHERAACSKRWPDRMKLGWRSDAQIANSGVHRNGKTDDPRGDDSRHRHCRCPDLQEPFLGTTDGEHRNRSGVCRFLFAIL